MIRDTDLFSKLRHCNEIDNRNVRVREKEKRKSKSEIEIEKMLINKQKNLIFNST